MHRVYRGRAQRLSRRLKEAPSEHLAGGRVFVHAELDERMLPHVARLSGRDDIFLFTSDFPHEPWTEICEELDEFVGRRDVSDTLKTEMLAGAAQRFYRLDATGAWVGPDPATARV